MSAEIVITPAILQNRLDAWDYSKGDYPLSKYEAETVKKALNAAVLSEYAEDDGK